MEDQGKRLLIAVAVAFAIMMVWTMLFPASKPEKQAEEKPPAAEASGATPGGAAAGTPATPVAPATPGGAPAAAGQPVPAAPQRGPEETFTFEFEDIKVTFSSYGGSVSKWELLGEQFHVPGNKAIPDDLARLKTDSVRLFDTRFADGSTFAIPAGAEWKGTKSGEREMTFTWSSDHLSVTKRYTLHPENYLVELDVEYKVTGGEAKQSLVVTLTSEQDPKQKKPGRFTRVSREWKAACYVDGDVSSWSTGSLTDRPREERGSVQWGGFVHSYFLVAGSPRTAPDQMYGCRAYPVPGTVGGMAVDIVYPETQVRDASTVKGQLVAYLGPKYLDRLQAIAGLVDQDPKFEKAVDLGFWGFIAGPLLWILQGIYSFVGIWGVSIILLTMLVKLVTLYWTHKSMKSMRAMASLRPQLDKIREKNKDDKQKQQVETMALFKAHGVNPLAGCLPMLLQMPIWFALYRALSVAAELYQAEFLWFKDLTAPDPYYILPVFMTVTMLFQSRLTPTTATGAQQKIMTYGMPLMFGGFSLFFPAGLTLYISTNTVLTLCHHLYMRKGDLKAKLKHAAGGDVEVLAARTDAPDESPETGDVEVLAARPSAGGGKAGSSNGISAKPGVRGQQARRGGGKRSKRGSKSS